LTQNATRLRADAHRNRERIIAAAREVFLEQGIDASLEEIARRAGVGIATLYRRFPDRHTLVLQVAMDNLALLGEEIDRASAEHSDAWGALVRIVRRMVELRFAVLFLGLVPGLKEDLRAEEGELKARRNQILGRLGELVHAAQQEGHLREGIGILDVTLGVIKLTRPLPVIGTELNALVTDRQLELFLGSLRATALDATEPLRREPLTLDEVDRHLKAME
jgi:AcrR family transcriptional regulator